VAKMEKGNNRRKKKRKVRAFWRPLMFDFVDETADMVWTDYGEELPADFIKDATKHKRSKLFETKMEAESKTKELKTKQKEEMLKTFPFTLKDPVAEIESVSYRCAVQFIDFEGRTDLRAFRNVIQRLSPKMTIAIHGDFNSTTRVKKTVQERAPSCKLVATPSCGEYVDAKTDSSVKKFALHGSIFDSKVNRLFSKPHTIGDYVVVYVEGELLPPTKADKAKLDTLHTIRDGSAEACRRTVPEQLVSAGEVRLVDVKQGIASAGFATDFADGILYCSGGVSVRKTPSGDSLNVTGPLCEEYFKIREIVLKQYCRI